MKILVTGASGYLGGRLCHELLKQGHSVHALVRPTGDLSSLPPPSPTGNGGLELVYGHVTDYNSLFSGCDVVFQAAAVVEPWLPDPSKFFSNVLRAVRETKTVKKIIYTPSFFALGPTDSHVADKAQVHHEKFFCTEYEKSKAAADKMALQATQQEELPLVLLYPGGRASVLFFRITGKLPLIRPPTVHVLRHQWAYSCDKGKQELDYILIKNLGLA